MSILLKLYKIIDLEGDAVKSHVHLSCGYNIGSSEVLCV